MAVFLSVIQILSTLVHTWPMVELQTTAMGVLARSMYWQEASGSSTSITKILMMYRYVAFTSDH